FRSAPHAPGSGCPLPSVRPGGLEASGPASFVKQSVNRQRESTMSSEGREEARNFRLLGHDPSAAWGGGSLVEVKHGHAYVGAVGGSSYHGPEGFTAHDVSNPT